MWQMFKPRDNNETDKFEAHTSAKCLFQACMRAPLGREARGRMGRPAFDIVLDTPYVIESETGVSGRSQMLA